ncbi:nucleotidyltransferase-like protein [Caryophanon latum]|uniref:Nucleotidyltransferase-like domain-containing protein n=1 Tax=Caryophanon latum TaxID=33977 RepID=A0A1C0YVY6_9BACL|nr:nucleotidyltransferase-like protein [Caryophanon latum]OCS91332.1 hypothetical protein A6K76_09130 [Caryophanon latum]
MEHVLRPIYQERASNAETLGIILVDKKQNETNVTDTFDKVLLVIVKDAEKAMMTKHYTFDYQKAVMHTITEKQLRKWLLIGSHRRLVDWLFNGKVLFDRNEFLHTLKMELKAFPFDGRKIKTGIQFAMLIRRYIEGKELFEQKNYLDAYNHVVDSLHHLARLSVIDSGLYPEVTVWAQVKRLEPAIYKLYEELILSDEPIDKRLELLFLASEFMIHSRTADGAQHILSVMKEQDAWTIQQLHEHKELSNYSKDLEVFIEYLVEREYIEVEAVMSKNEMIFHRYYKVGKQ